MPGEVAHVITGQEWAAYISAAASVGQAITAGLAIWYSGKLARDSAKRERLADENAARRIAEADAAAEEQRRLDRAARHAAEVELFNQPIDLAIALAESAYDEIRETRNQFSAAAEHSPTTLYALNIGLHQTVAMQRITAIEDRVDHSELVSAIRRLAMTVDPFGSAVIAPGDWLPVIDKRLEEIRDAITRLYIWRKIPA